MEGALDAILASLRFYINSFNSLNLTLFGKQLTFVNLCLIVITLSFVAFILYGDDD